MARDTNFYYSFLVLPPAKRRAIVGVWDFCRAVDDAVDEADPRDVQVGETLDAWRREVALGESVGMGCLPWTLAASCAPAGLAGVAAAIRRQ